MSTIIRQAFSVWATALTPAPPEFTRGRFYEVDWRPTVRIGPRGRRTTITHKPFIRISFAAGQHERLVSHQRSDTFAADELAHAYLPRGEMTTEDPDKNIGAICLNTAVRWSLDGSSGTYDLMSAAIHEIGHALGLGHSDDSASVMYFSADGSPKRILTPEDVAMIRMLYP